MDARYLQAATVLPHQDKVCGRTLLAFCLRHRVALEAIGSPFLDPMEKRFTAFDVILAVRIMSTHDKQKMTDKLSLSDKYHVARMMLSKNRLSLAIGMVLGCMKVSCSYPKLWEKDNKDKKSSEDIPWMLSCVANLTRNGVGLEEAWTMPEGEAVWMSISHAIYNGAKIDILTTDQEDELLHFNERVDAYKKRMNHKN